MFGPIFERASTRHTDIRFGKVDTEAERDLAAAAKIMSIPTLMAFRDGVLVFSQPGAIAEPALDEVIPAVRDLDMDDVRRQLAERAEAGQPS
jgi:thioredoxin 1